MGKFFGAIGYAETKETAPGVSEEIITERNYKGDVIRNARRLENGEHLNDNVNVNNSISIVADGFASQSLKLNTSMMKTSASSRCTNKSCD